MPKPIGQSLPSVENCGLEGNGLSVWNALLQAEVIALNHQTQAKYNDPVVGIRVLGFLLKDLFDHAQDGYTGIQPYSRLCLEISSCLDKKDGLATYNAIVDLGLRYRNHLFRVFRSNTGARPTPSLHPSRPSFDVIQDRILQDLDAVPQTRSSVRNQALMRDGYKCVISGLYDTKSCQNIEEVDNASISEEVSTTYTEVAHIFSESAQDGDKQYSATAFAILKLFGLEKQVEELYGGKVNSLPNVMTMAASIHNAFDVFDLWLEPVPHQRNTYNVCTVPSLRGRFTPQFPGRVTLIVDPTAAAKASANNKELSLPDPDLIAIRAACARVANLSGAAEQADQIFRDLESIRVMADDGGTAGLLATRLSMVQQTIDVAG